MIALTVLQQLITLFLIIFVGYILTRTGPLTPGVSKGLSSILTQAALPALVLAGMQVDYTPALLGSLGIAAGCMAISILLGALICVPVCLLLKVPLRASGVWLCCAAFPNSIYIGKPIMVALLGDWVEFPLVGVLFTFNMLVFSMGVFFLGMGGEGRAESPVRTFLRTLRAPAIIVTGIGLVLFLFSWRLPAPVLSAVQMLGATVTPISMLIIGHALAQANLRELFGDPRLYILSGLRLLAAPVAAWLLLRFLVHDPDLLALLVISSAMPVGSAVGVLAEQHDNNSLFCSRTIFLSTLLCIPTVPLITLLLT